MISSISGFLSLNNLDMTSSANDVIVVRHPNGRLFSTPFNVRFGKVKVLRPSDKVVQVEVNGRPTSAVMKTGSDGEAFWLKPTRWSERDGGRPESPLAASDAFPSSSATQQRDSCNSSARGSVETLQPTEPVTGAVSPPAVDTKTDGSAATEPLLEEDQEGHLKVNAVVRKSLNDLKEVQLAEDTVVAANMAMQRIAQMPMAYNDYLRETALQEEKERILSGDISKLECRFKASEDDLLSAVDAPNATVPMTGCGISTAAAESGKEKSAIVSVEVFPEEEERNTPEIPTTWRTEGAGEMHPEYFTTPKHSKLRDPGTSLAASDEGFDTLGDDYLFEDAIHPDEYAGGFDCYNVGETPSTALAGQEAGSNLSVMAVVRPPTADLQRLINSASPSEEESDMVYFTRTLIPTEADLRKLNLVGGHNKVRYITYSSLRGEVAVEANVYLWDSTDRLVVSDVDGTITKSDLWGHLMPLLGRDWTHSGICSLYSKIDRNGYKFVYLTARSVSQVGMTRNFLWKIEQDGFCLPKGPVLTAPERFFTALTQEVSKKSHVFKIACLKSVLDTFPPHSKPFYAGFGNRFSDVVSYTATQIPQHKIFIIDPNSVLHVYNVKQTFKNLAHLVDVTFPPVVKRIQPQLQSPHTQCKASGHPAASGGLADAEVGSNGSFTALNGTARNGLRGPFSSDGSESPSPFCGDDGRNATFSIPVDAGFLAEDNACRCRTTTTTAPPESHVEVAIDQEFHPFLYWRLQPADLVTTKKEVQKDEKACTEAKQQKPQKSRRWLTFSLGTSSHNNNNGGEPSQKGGDEVKTQHVYGAPAPAPAAAATDVLDSGATKTEGPLQEVDRVAESGSALEEVAKEIA
ncbi:putative lipin [Trypanosoma rangeli]|uniref:Putative lipin n=1 Tax=Trypanosoma rangeli TaxID=5698 RepID=A0A422NZF8_TRYRA|nr:putative lipin [Trypanosoma rangeli]RNF10824.1 putative lipin [Trypanosoma rangeli]|eukprot:RNF10824.1 putative lipin [Trypanosoma rangeli]